MGSFTEIVMSFALCADTPPAVLAAFSSLAVPRPGAPALPPPAAKDLWSPQHVDGGADVPWAYDWGPCLGADLSASVDSAVGATLTWSPQGRWVVTTRAVLPGYPDEIAPSLGWLGRHIAPGPGGDSFLVGYMKHEFERRPWLLWHDGEALSAEDLNGDDDRL